MPPLDLTDSLRALAADAVRDAVQPAVAAALAAAMPEILRRAALPVYLSRQQVMEMTGWSDRKLAYLQAKRRLAFVKRGRTVVFRTADVEAYLGDGYVPAKRTGAVGAGHTNGRAQGASSPG